MKAIEALQTINAYPIPAEVVIALSAECGLDYEATIDSDVMQSGPYNRVKGRLYLWLAEAPNVTQAGISFSFSERERKTLKNKGNALLSSVGEDLQSTTGEQYGYMGESL